MKKLIFLSLISLVFLSCESEPVLKTDDAATPLFDVHSCRAGVELLCETFSRLSDEQLTDEQYNRLQIQVEAIYLGLEFGVNAGFYTDEDILVVADSLECVM